MTTHNISFYEYSENGELIKIADETYKTEKEARDRFIKAVSLSFTPAEKMAILWEEKLKNNRIKPMGKFIITGF